MQGIWSHFFLGRRWINNQRESNSVWYNTPHWKIIALICYARRSPKVTLITVFVSIVAWKQARWPPLFITFLISPCLITSTYQVSKWRIWMIIAVMCGFIAQVGRASHQYRGDHGFESRWSLDFFQASSFLLLKLENLLRWSFFTLIYNRSSNIWIISYILRIISLLTGDMNSINWPRFQCVAS